MDPSEEEIRQGLETVGLGAGFVPHATTVLEAVRAYQRQPPAYGAAPGLATSARMCVHLPPERDLPRRFVPAKGW